MTAELHRLIETVAAMPDDDLVRMVYRDAPHYRIEALTYARAELQRRGICVTLASLETAHESASRSFFAVLPGLVWAARRRIVRILGFGIGLFYFAWANLESHEQISQFLHACPHCTASFGFPFSLYQAGGYAGPVGVLWCGLIADLIIALATSATVGWLIGVVVTRLSSQRNAV